MVTQSVGLHDRCPRCRCPLPDREHDPRFKRTPRPERWGWMILSLLSGKGYGVWADGTFKAIPYGRKTIIRLHVGSLWRRRWLVRRWRYRWFQTKQPCGCTRRRWTNRRLCICRDHLHEVFTGIRTMRGGR